MVLKDFARTIFDNLNYPICLLSDSVAYRIWLTVVAGELILSASACHIEGLNAVMGHGQTLLVYGTAFRLSSWIIFRNCNKQRRMRVLFTSKISLWPVHVPIRKRKPLLWFVLQLIH